jgi:hypothetical protein
MREHYEFVNMNNLGGRALEQALESKLKELLSSIPWLHNLKVKELGQASDSGFDFEVTLPLANGKSVLAVECKGELRPSAFHRLDEKKAFLPQGSRPIVPVLAMPFVSPRLADLCVQNGWSWYDLAGNCHIDVADAIYLELRGHKPVHSRSRPTANLSTPEAARIIRALLAPGNASRRWTQRDMETHFAEQPKPPIPEPSLGLVNKVVKHLRDEAFIEASPDGGFRLRDPLKLLFAWRDAYRFDRHERRHYFTLLQGKELRDALFKLDLDAGGFAAYAAFSAADLQAPHVRQPKTWLYVGDEYVKRFEEFTEAKRVESGENIIALIPDDAGVFYQAEGPGVGDQRMAATNPVQTYVDLSHCGGRGEEAAHALLEQKLKPYWSQYTPR